MLLRLESGTVSNQNSIYSLHTYDFETQTFHELGLTISNQEMGRPDMMIVPDAGGEDHWILFISEERELWKARLDGSDAELLLPDRVKGQSLPSRDMVFNWPARLSAPALVMGDHLVTTWTDLSRHYSRFVAWR
jgi:hypothetical protein